MNKHSMDKPTKQLLTMFEGKREANQKIDLERSTVSTCRLGSIELRCSGHRGHRRWKRERGREARAK
jgi:hypothetical protein